MTKEAIILKLSKQDHETGKFTDMLEAQIGVIQDGKFIPCSLFLSQGCRLAMVQPMVVTHASIEVIPVKP